MYVVTNGSTNGSTNVDMKTIIRQQLEQIEKKWGVKVLFAVESGSRAWGFESQDSDYDVRFVYCHPQKTYLSVFEQPTTIEIPVDAVLDINGWDLKKALQLLYKSNAPLCEWLLSKDVYTEEPGFREAMLECARLCHSRVGQTHHYLNLARKSYETRRIEADGPPLIRLKKLFYTLRPICACLWMEQRGGLAPMELDEILQGLSEEAVSRALRQEIATLVEIKKGCTEKDETPLTQSLIDFIETQMKRLELVAKGYKDESTRNTEVLDTFFIKTLSEFGDR